MKNQVWKLINIIAIIISIIAGIFLIRNRIVFDKLNTEYIIIVERNPETDPSQKSIYNFYSESFMQLHNNDYIGFQLFKYLISREQFDILETTPGIVLKPNEVQSLNDICSEEITMKLRKDFIFIILEEFEEKDIGEYEINPWLIKSVFRGHRIPDNVISKVSQNELWKRMQRAVYERNVRALIIQPELLDTIPKLVNNLEKQRYFKTFSLQQNSFNTSKILILLIIIGVFTISLISLFEGFGLPEILFPIPWIALFFLSILSNFSEIAPQFYQVMALITACAYPSLIALLAIQKRNQNPLLEFLLYSGISILAGIFIYSILSTPEFIIYAKRFRGVKLSFIIPFFMLFFFILSLYYDEIKKFFINKSSTRMLIFFIFIIILIAVLRTMNTPILGKTQFELAIRNLLEDVFNTRPRFKEFLIGHPFLLMGLYLKKKNRSNILWIVFMFLGLVGQVSIVNSFCHITHPFMLPLKSVMLSIVFGGILGIFGIFTMFLILSMFGNESYSRKDINQRILR